jgi:hypothetical protein
MEAMQRIRLVRLFDDVGWLEAQIHGDAAG